MLSCLEVSASSGEDEDIVAVDELGEDSDAVLKPDKPSNKYIWIPYYMSSCIYILICVIFVQCCLQAK